MGVDIAEIKARLSLAELLASDGLKLHRAGGGRWLALCPLHSERTPSFTVYQGKDGGQKYKCWGCGASGDLVDYWRASRNVELAPALENLAQLVGLAVGGGLVKKRIVPKVVAVPAEEVKALDELGVIKWSEAATMLKNSEERLKAWAEWRGLSVDVIRWAAERRLCGALVYRSEWREAFLIERPVKDGSGVQPVGWHVRLAPRSHGNGGDRATWRYEPLGIGAWPVVVLPEGGIKQARFIFICEGQWDVLALVDLMGWYRAWPAEAAVFGLRGATTWRRLMDYAWRADATMFLLADQDEAGRRWFVGEECFAEEVRKKVRFVYGFWPKMDGVKDLNDGVRAMSEPMRNVVRRELRMKVLPSKTRCRVTKVTFFSWVKGQKERQDVVGEFGRWVVDKRGTTPKGRSRRAVWQRYMQPYSEARMWWEAAWKEWEKL